MSRASKVCCVVCLLLAAAVSARSVDEKQDERIGRLISQLDHKQFAVREAATKELIKIGTAALPQLRKAARKGTPEVRQRAEYIIDRTFYDDIQRRFTALAAKPDESLDLEHGMWLISRLMDPEVTEQTLKQQLDVLAEKVRKRLGKGFNPKAVDPEKAVAAIRQVIFADLKFNGNERDYDNPVNSSLHRVLKTRQGLPILLSHVVISVAKRLQIPIVGIGIPGRYMCKYEDRRAIAKTIIINPFEAGRIMSFDQLKQEYPSVTASYLQPDTNRSALARMLRNLEADYTAVGQDRMAGRVESYLQLFEK